MFSCYRRGTGRTELIHAPLATSLPEEMSLCEGCSSSLGSLSVWVQFGKAQGLGVIIIIVIKNHVNKFSNLLFFEEFVMCGTSTTPKITEV